MTSAYNPFGEVLSKNTALKIISIFSGFKKYNPILILIILLLYCFVFNSYGQTESTAWGNIEGIRVEGELMKFETSIRVFQKSWLDYNQTAKERQEPGFVRKDSKAIINTMLDSLAVEEVIEDKGTGKASVFLTLKALADTAVKGAYFSIELPNADFADATFKYIDKKQATADTAAGKEQGRFERFLNPVPDIAKGIVIRSGKRRLEIKTDSITAIYLVPANPYLGSGNTVIYFTLFSGPAVKGQSVIKNFNISVSGKIDRKPVKMVLDTLHPGREFDGLGGNFRLQNPRIDPEVIDYCLKNLNIRWGRVELPWFNWQRDETVDPLKAAREGQINEHVVNSMKMAQQLAKRNIHIIISVWYPPLWAIEGKLRFGPHIPGTPFGNPLNPMKMRSIIKSLGAYLIYLKEEYGVSPDLFSFNESDLGINVRMTGEEHAEFIKQFGAYLASKGLTTKLLLGDNSDANTYGFLTPALNDPSTYKYIGAVSFHSWRGYNDWTLSIWADIARQINVPLIVGEGSTDAAAWKYPDIFLEPSYALNEISIYVSIYSICQAKSILQWQLTSDYSVLTGGGIYGTKGPLKPTQRFWNLKQLGLTPAGSFYLPIAGNGREINCVAFGDIKDSIYTVHIVNNGAERKVTLTGLPACINKMKMYITDRNHGMENVRTVNIEDGKAVFNLEPACFTTLINK